MRQKKVNRKFWIGAAFLLGCFFMTQSAWALDAPHSRKGPFTGVGFIGGGGLIFADDTVGIGDLGLNLQLGLGASENFTVSLNLDNRLHIGSHVVQGMIVPGPRFTVFVAKNIYLNAGVGLALGLKVEPDNDNAVGMNVNVGGGYERFVNTNLAAYVGLGGDYYFLNDADDVLAFTMVLGIRYY